MGNDAELFAALDEARGRRECEELVAALERISAVQMTEPPPITDPDWMARLMQHIARTALAKYWAKHAESPP